VNYIRLLRGLLGAIDGKNSVLSSVHKLAHLFMRVDDGYLGDHTPVDPLDDIISGSASDVITLVPFVVEAHSGVAFDLMLLSNRWILFTVSQSIHKAK
jgi:hypothetical protein